MSQSLDLLKNILSLYFWSKGIEMAWNVLLNACYSQALLIWVLHGTLESSRYLLHLLM